MTQIHWLNAVSGAFTDASDWSGGKVPGASDDAILDAAGETPFTVTASASESVSSIQTNSDATLSITSGTFTATNGSGAGENAGTISASNGAGLTLGGTVNNAGSILDFGVEGSDITTVIDISQSATFTGGGHVTFIPNGSYGESGLEGGTLTNVNNTISGDFGVNLVGLINDKAGIIDTTDFFGNGALGSEITADSISNAGLIECTGTYTLALLAGDGTINNTGGTILAGNGSIVELGSASRGSFDVLEGGTLQTSGTGSISANYVTLDGLSATVNNQGSLRENGGSVAFEGTIDNSGAISLSGVLQVNSTNAFLTGDGQVMLNGGAITGAAAGAVLTDVANTISGSGSIGAFGHSGEAFSLVNESAAVINANGSIDLLVETGTYPIINTGLIEATGTGGLILRAATITNANGTISVGTGSTLTMQGSVVDGGTFSSSGTALVRVQDAGNVIDVGSTAVALTGELVVVAGASLTATAAFDVSGKFLNEGVTTVNDALTNTGVLESAGGSLTVEGIVSGSGEVLVAGGSMTLGSGLSQNEVVISSGASLTVDGEVDVTSKIVAKGNATLNGAVTNNGVLETAGGSLTVQGAVTGSGDAVIDGGTMIFGSSFDQKTVFDGAGTLVLSDSQGFTGTIWKFSTSGANSLDLKDIAFGDSTKATYSGTASGGVLTVTDGTHTAEIALKGNYLSSTFTVANDGHGGTTVTDPTSSDSARLAGFVAASASFGASSGGEAFAGAEASFGKSPVLARPAG